MDSLRIIPSYTKKEHDHTFSMIHSWVATKVKFNQFFKSHKSSTHPDKFKLLG